ncbi:MAG: rod shape-determining protein MreD [Rhodospirillaceae bacterium]|nr:rod shape-determining protein MreD [Rhodospirillaceae bacterium]
MTPRLLHHVDAIARVLVPALLGIVLVIVSTIPFHIPWFGPVTPNFVLIAIFFWGVHRIYFFSNITVFFIGLLLDILVGTPPGLNAIVLVLVRNIAVSQAKVFRGKPFLVLWLGFGLISFVTGAVIWALNAIYHMTLVDPLPIVFQMAMTFTVFPLLAWLFARTQRKLFQQT